MLRLDQKVKGETSHGVRKPEHSWRIKLRDINVRKTRLKPLDTSTCSQMLSSSFNRRKREITPEMSFFYLYFNQKHYPHLTLINMQYQSTWWSNNTEDDWFGTSCTGYGDPFGTLCTIPDWTLWPFCTGQVLVTSSVIQRQHEQPWHYIQQQKKWTTHFGKHSWSCEIPNGEQ